MGPYWRERRRQRAEVYVPLSHHPGEAQLDFFEVVVEVGGERVWRRFRASCSPIWRRRSKRGADATGKPASELWQEERAQLLPLPTTSFEVRKPVPVEISSRSMVRIEGAWYSVPSRWARLSAIAYLGVDDVRITCMGESVSHPRARFGTRQVRYRHYLPELAKKPHAVRQVRTHYHSFVDSSPGSDFDEAQGPGLAGIKRDLVR